MRGKPGRDSSFEGRILKYTLYARIEKEPGNDSSMRLLSTVGISAPVCIHMTKGRYFTELAVLHIIITLN